MIRKAFAWVSIFMLLFQSMSSDIYAAAMTVNGDDVLEEVMERGWYSEEGELRYPITMDDELWKELFSNENKIRACQIPEDIVIGLSTEKLLYMIEEYPNFTITYQDDNPQEGFQRMLDNCLALEVMLERGLQRRCVGRIL